MRATHRDPRILLAAVAASLCALVAATAAPSLPDIQLRADPTPPPVAAPVQDATPANLSWVMDPLALPPLLSEAR